MSQKVFALSFAAFTLPIAFGLLILAAITMHFELYAYAPAFILIAFAMALSGFSSVKHAYQFELTPLASWMGARYRKALLAKDYKHARKWNALCRRHAAQRAYKPTIVPAAVFFIFGLGIIVPSTFAIAF